MLLEIIAIFFGTFQSRIDETRAIDKCLFVWSIWILALCSMDLLNPALEIYKYIYGDGFNRHLKFTMTCLSFNVIRFHSSLFVIRFRVFPSSNSNFLFHSTKWWPISVCELNVNVNCVRRLFIKFFFFISQKSVLDVYTVLLLLIHHSSSIIPRRRKNLLPNSIAPDLFVSLWTQCTQFTIYNVHECTHTDTHTHAQSQTIWDVNHSLLSIIERQSITKQYKFINY